jgi:hypothetical protein
MGIFLHVLLVLVPHDRQDPGKIHYSGPVLYFMVKYVLNSQKAVFYPESVFYTALPRRLYYARTHLGIALLPC